MYVSDIDDGTSHFQNVHEVGTSHAKRVSGTESESESRKKMRIFECEKLSP